MGNVFTAKFLLLITGVLILSSAFSHVFLSSKNSPPTASTSESSISTISTSPSVQTLNVDEQIDQALEYSINGSYDESFPILRRLAEQNITRAKLYLAVAYYHGHGVQKNKNQAKSIFLDLHDKNYEMGIVNTYLNLIAYTDQ